MGCNGSSMPSMMGQGNLANNCTEETGHIYIKRYVPLLILLLTVFCFSLTACTTKSHRGGGVQSGPYKGPKGTKPYTIRGITYYPLASGVGFSEEGIASWYGKDFHGKKTANGEVYDMYGMTAAHKLLPFNTQVRVTNLNNGKSIVVRVNDRGPFVEKRVIDLTHTGASNLGMLGPGTTRVRVESVGAVAGLSEGDMKGTFYVQVGAFSSQANAKRLSSQIKNSGKGSRYYYADMVGFWRVQVGPYSSLQQAENARAGLRSTYPGCFVVAQ